MLKTNNQIAKPREKLNNANAFKLFQSSDTKHVSAGNILSEKAPNVNRLYEKVRYFSVILFIFGFTLVSLHTLEFNFSDSALASIGLTLGEIESIDGHLGASVILPFSFLFLLISFTIEFRARMSHLSSRQETEEIFRAYSSAMSANSIVSVTDNDGTIIEVNDLFVKYFGYSREELIGENSGIIYANKSQDHNRPEIKATLDSGATWVGKQKLQAKSGEIVFTQTAISTIFDKKNNHRFNVSIRNDITDKEKDYTENFLASTLSDLQDEVYLYKIDTLEIIYANKSACNRCDWNSNEFGSKRITDSSLNFVEAAFRAHVKPLLTEETDLVSIELVHEKGPVEIKTRIYVTPAGDQMFLSVLRDLSERKRLEQAKFESVSIISHELRTPLTSIKGSLGLLNTGSIETISPKVSQILSIASRNTEKLLALVDGILDLEKIRSEKFKCQMSPVELPVIVSEAVTLNQGYGIEHGVVLKVDKVPESAVINGNFERLLQVLANLISNAIKYSSAGSEVVLNVRSEGRNWLMSVRDYGPGIAAEKRDEVFQSFGQVPAEDGITRPGTGLGLTIAKRIVELHHGKIDFKSQLGDGTEFFVLLPKFDAASSAECSERAA